MIVRGLYVQLHETAWEDYWKGLLKWNAILDILFRKATSYLRSEILLIDTMKYQAPNPYTMDTQIISIPGTQFISVNCREEYRENNWWCGKGNAKRWKLYPFCIILSNGQEIHDYLGVFNLGLDKSATRRLQHDGFLSVTSLWRLKSRTGSNMCAGGRIGNIWPFKVIVLYKF